MKLYNNFGYLNFDEIGKLTTPFNFIVGARGIGKTYGAIEYMFVNNYFFLFMRRTQTQLDSTMNGAFNPFKAVDENITIKSAGKNLKALYKNDETGNPAGLPICYCAALSTFSNLRGFDAAAITHIIYDEFIPENHEVRTFGEANALLNAYETINRNRELNGQAPVKLFALANSNYLANDLFMQLQLITTAEKLKESSRDSWTDEKRGITLIMPKNSPISEAKQQTALYKLAAGTDFSTMAINNNFANEDIYNIKPLPIKEYNPLISCGEINIYKHKSNGTYYITEHASGTPIAYNSTPSELMQFRRKIVNNVWPAWTQGRVYYQSYIQKLLFEKYIGVKL